MSTTPGSSPTATLLTEVEALIARFIALRDEYQAATVALYVLHTHAQEVAETTPYLAVLSAEKRSGKSRLLELLAGLCARAEHVSGVSEAALFQLVEARRPTLLVDEVDAVFAQAAERTEALRGAINSGNRKAGSIVRGGKDGKPTRYSTYCPKVLAGIENGKLPDTIRDRAIPIIMRRKPPGVQVERLLWRDAGDAVQAVHDALASWGGKHEDTLRAARPDLPTQLDDRTAEGWEPLLAIADLAGGEWPDRARVAALALAGDFVDEEESRGVRLLADLRTVLTVDAMATADLLSALNALEESPWGSWHDANGMSARDLARLLRPYEVKPRTVRLDGATPKGYVRADLVDAWSRYLPTVGGGHPPQAPQAPQTPRIAPVVADVADVADISGLRNGSDEYRPATAEEEALAAQALGFFDDLDTGS